MLFLTGENSRLICLLLSCLVIFCLPKHAAAINQPMRRTAYILFVWLVVSFVRRTWQNSMSVITTLETDFFLEMAPEVLGINSRNRCCCYINISFLTGGYMRTESSKKSQSNSVFVICNGPSIHRPRTELEEHINFFCFSNSTQLLNVNCRECFS